MLLQEIFNMGTQYDTILNNALRNLTKGRSRVNRSPVVIGGEEYPGVGKSNLSWVEALRELGVNLSAPAERLVNTPSYREMRKVLQTYIEMRTGGGREMDKRLDRGGIKHLADVITRWLNEVNGK